MTPLSQRYLPDRRMKGLPKDRRGLSFWPFGASPTLLGKLAAIAPPALMVLTLGACSTGGQKLTQSGFLDDYSKMTPQPGHKNALIFVREGFEGGAYTKVIIDPVAWRAHDRKSDVEQKLEADFHDRLTKVLSKRFEVVNDAPVGETVGPGVLRVKSAITNTRKALWYLNVGAMAGSAALGGVPIPPPSAGGASEEIAVSDGQSGADLIQIATFTNGMPWNVKGEFIAYGHADLAFQRASELLQDVIKTGYAPPMEKK